jgi:Holliday junction resolvase RusA-like endonuclease
MPEGLGHAHGALAGAGERGDVPGDPASNAGSSARRTDAVAFTVVGRIGTAGSKVRNPNGGVREASKTDRPWRAVVVDEALREMGERPLLLGPLAVTFTFYWPRRGGHYGTGRNAGIVRAGAPAYPGIRPDLLKQARSTEDALTGVVWRDDAQIVSEHLHKRWGEPERCEISVRPQGEA